MAVLGMGHWISNDFEIRNASAGFGIRHVIVLPIDCLLNDYVHHTGLAIGRSNSRLTFLHLNWGE